MKLNRFTILHKGLLVIGIPLLYQALFIGLLLKRQHEHNEAQHGATHTKVVLLQIDRVYRLLIESQSNLRGYLLFGEDGFRNDVEDSTVRAKRELESLKQLVAGNPMRQARFAKVQKCAEGRFEYQQTLLGVLHTRGRDEAVATARNLKGRELLAALHNEIDAFQSAEEALGRERLETLRKSSLSQTALLLSGLAITVVVGAGVAVLFSREISGRILVLTENTRRMARGESLPQLVHGSDEVAELDVQFHRMAEELAKAREREHGYKETLERRAAELTDANRELDQKSRENEMFVYSVSHDLRSPLVNLQGFSKELDLARQDLARLLAGPGSDMATKQAQRITEQEISDSIRYIQTAVTRLSGIIDALLRLSRAGRVEYHCT
ncbi:MAG: CHASE3 domain-containing protein, partial [Verrucomicrobiota bacterium]|nr:CHASE3 domain-containing protein [Verrucomicrobiota bacterium]